MKDECYFGVAPEEAPSSFRLPPSSFRGYSTSSKRLAISRVTAARASCSSGPSVSTNSVEPLAAASIMTPMMLLALLRRPLRLTQRLDLKRPARSVSLADARACRPSLLMISTSCCSIVDDKRRGGDAHHAVTPAAYRLGDDGGERPVAVIEDPDQHRQVHAPDTLDLAGDEQLGGDVGGRAA